MPTVCAAEQHPRVRAHVGALGLACDVGAASQAGACVARASASAVRARAAWRTAGARSVGSAVRLAAEAEAAEAVTAAVLAARRLAAAQIEGDGRVARVRPVHLDQLLDALLVAGEPILERVQVEA